MNEQCEKCGVDRINGECDCTYGYSDDYAKYNAPLTENDIIYLVDPSAWNDPLVTFPSPTEWVYSHDGRRAARRSQR